HKRNQADISDFVFRKCFANVFRPERAQMDDAGAADEGPEEAHHEVNGVIRGKNAQITHARPEGINRRERDALFEIVLVRHHAALRPAARAGGIDNWGESAAAARDEKRLGRRTELFPTKRAAEFDWWSFRDQDFSHVRGGSAFPR